VATPSLTDSHQGRFGRAGEQAPPGAAAQTVMPWDVTFLTA